MRTATFADGLAIHGGAPSHDYEGSSNKVAHLRGLRHFVADTYMGWSETSQANPTRPRTCRDRELTDLITASSSDRHLDPSADFEWRAGAADAMPFPRQIVIPGDGGTRAFDWALSRLTVCSPSLERA